MKTIERILTKIVSVNRTTPKPGTLTDAGNKPNPKTDLKIILNRPDGSTFCTPKTNMNLVRWHRLQP